MEIIFSEQQLFELSQENRHFWGFFQIQSYNFLSDLQNFSPITMKKIIEIFFVWNSRWGIDTKFEIVIPRLWLVLRENDSERKLNSKLNYLENPYNYQIWWIWDQEHLCDFLNQEYF